MPKYTPDINQYHKNIANNLSHLVEERRRLRDYLNSNNIPRNSTDYARVYSQIQQLSSQIQEEIRINKSEDPNSYISAKQEVIHRSEDARKLLQILINEIRINGFYSCINDFKKLDSRYHFRLALYLIESNNIYDLIENLNYFSGVNTKEKQFAIVKSIIKSGDARIILDNLRKFTLLNDTESQVSVAVEIARSGIEDSDQIVVKNFRTFNKINDTQSQLKVALEVIDSRGERTVAKYLKNFRAINDTQSQMEIALQIIRRGRGHLVVRYFENFSAITQKEDQITIARSLLENGAREKLEKDYHKLDKIDRETLLKLIKETSNKDVLLDKRIPVFARRFKLFESSALLNDRNLVFKKNLEGSLKKISSLRLLRATVFRDMIKISTFSSDTELLNYLYTIQEVEDLITKFEGGEELSINELEILNRTLARMETLYNESQLSKLKSQKIQEDEVLEISTEERINNLRDLLGVNSDTTISERLTEMFYRPLGVSSISELIELISSKQILAHERNLEYAQDGRIDLRNTILKAFKRRIIPWILNNGIMAGEMRGETDSTPLDIDAMEYDGSKPISLLQINRYGDVMIVLKNEGQYVYLDEDMSNKNQVLTGIDTYELIRRDAFAEHVAIRTGVPSTEIRAIVLTETFLQAEGILKEQIFFCIANNGFYIPVCTEDGTVIFTIEDYNRYKIDGGRLLQTASSEVFDPKELLSQMSENPYISDLLELPVGVKENYSSYRHTLMVLNQFEKYFADSDLSESILSKEEFRIFLALHDIGKSQGFLVEGDTRNQHQYSEDVIVYLLHSIGLNPRSIDTFFELLNQDIIGKYLKEDIDLDRAEELIQLFTNRLGTTIQKSYKTLEIMYMCDASSYTADAGGIPSLDRLFNFRNGTISFSQATLEKIQLLKERLGI